MPTPKPHQRAARGLVLCLLLTATGCFSPALRVADRTSTEQELTTLAVRRAVRSLDLASLRLPSPVRLKVTAPKKVDTGYVRSTVRHALADAFVRVATDRQASAPTLEVVVDFAASDTESSLLGIPIGITQVGIPLTDLSLYRYDSQIGRARIGLALWSPNGLRMRRVDPREARCHRSEYTFLSVVGPWIVTDLSEVPAEEDEPRP